MHSPACLDRLDRKEIPAQKERMAWWAGEDWSVSPAKTPYIVPARSDLKLSSRQPTRRRRKNDADQFEKESCIIDQPN